MPRNSTIGQIAKALNRPVVFISSLQTRFGLPTLPAYPPAYIALLRTLVNLRSFGISEDRLQNLWQLEKKLLQLLHVDSSGSTTWFLDSCGRTSNRRRRLLLTNHDLGHAVPADAVQLGLNFAEKPIELFLGSAMGEDELRILNQIIPLRRAMLQDVAAELPHLRQAAKWAVLLTGAGSR